MPRALALALLVSVLPCAVAVQEPGILRIKVVLVDADGHTTVPVPRHALLVSDNPSSAPPRRILTALDGTASVRLRPGNYTVESDQPVAFQGKAYQWTQIVDVAAGRDETLELTAANAEIVSAGEAVGAVAAEDHPSLLLARRIDSVAAVWTPTARASGFVIDARGLVATNQRAVGGATVVEVQFTPALKVAANVIASDWERDVAILRIDPTTASRVTPLVPGCGADRPAVARTPEVFSIGVPLGGTTDIASGTRSDLVLPTASLGGPVFTAGGDLVGLTSTDERDQGRYAASRIVPIEDVCAAVAAAEKGMKDAAPPGGAPLPVEPLRPVSREALESALRQRAGSLSPYQVSSSGFDIAFITPLMVHAQYAAEPPSRGGRGGTPDAAPTVRPVMDFGGWTEYVAAVPPVLLVRATPKVVEGFWTKVARGAAQTQGVSIPPIKRAKAGFLRMRAFCGGAEVPPIHPFRIERRVSENDVIYEGLYVFDPGALGPHCGTVKLTLYSEKEPGKADTRIVDPSVIEQIARDFAAYR